MLGETRLAPWLPGGERICPPLSAFWKLMRKLKPSVVVVRNPYTAYGLLSIATAKMTGAKAVYYSQNPVHRRLVWWKALVNSLTTWAANARHITPVLGSPERHPPAFGALRYVPFVMEPQTAPERKRWFRCDTVNIMTVGKFYRRKNHATVSRGHCAAGGKPFLCEQLSSGSARPTRTGASSARVEETARRTRARRQSSNQDQPVVPRRAA